MVLPPSPGPQLAPGSSAPSPGAVAGAAAARAGTWQVRELLERGNVVEAVEHIKAVCPELLDVRWEGGVGAGRGEDSDV